MVKKVVLSRYSEFKKGELIIEEFKNVEQFWFGKEDIFIETNKCVYPRKLANINNIEFNPKAS